MGGMVSSIFGFGQQYEAPDPIEYDPMPTRAEAADGAFCLHKAANPMPTRAEAADPESESARESERRKIKARRAMSGTLLTSPLGVNGSSGSSGGSGSSGPGLLGRV